MANNIIHLSVSDFDDIIAKESFILVDFWANWCGPCKMLAPVLEELAEETNIKIGKVDVDENEEIARRFNIMSIPSLIIFKKGEAVAKEIGYKNIAQLKMFVEQYK